MTSKFSTLRIFWGDRKFLALLLAFLSLYAAIPEGQALAVAPVAPVAPERSVSTVPLSSIPSVAQTPTAQSPWKTARLFRLITAPEVVTGSSDLIAVSPNGQQVASAINLGENSYANAVRVWDIHTGMPLYTVASHTDFISAIAFSPDGQTLATADYDYNKRLLTIRLWDAATGRRRRTLVRAISPRFYNNAFYHRAILAFSPDSQTLYSTAAYPMIQVWDINRGKLQRNLVGYRQVIRGMTVSPDGNTLASTHVDGTLSLFDLQNEQIIRTVVGGLDGFEVAFSPDGQSVAATFEFLVEASRRLRQVNIWETQTGRLTQSIAGYSDQEWLVLSPDGQTFAVATDIATSHQQLRLIDLNTGEELKAMPVVSSNIAFSPDGQTFVAATSRGIRVWRSL